jgi:hypothetical protein
MALAGTNVGKRLMFRWRGSIALGALGLACLVSCSSGPEAPGDPYGTSSMAIQGGTTDTSHFFAVGIVQTAQASQNMVAFCSGVLLAPNLVATARHCVAELATTTIDCSTSNFGNVYPASDLLVTTDTTITMNSSFLHVTNVIVPTGANQTSVCGNDIALLILKNNINLTKYAVPVIDPPMTSTTFQPVVTAIGYGITTPTDTAGDTAGTRRIKQNVQLTCIPNDSSFVDCFTDPVAKTILTAGEFVSGDSTCEGDSGSGAFEQGNFDMGNWLAFGVLSRGGVSTDGKTCEQPIYTRFDAWGPLIIQAAVTASQQAAARGQPYPLATWAGGTGPLADGGIVNSGPLDADVPGSGDDGGGGGNMATASTSGSCAVATPGNPAGRGAAGLLGAAGALVAVAGRRRRARPR